MSTFAAVSNPDDLFYHPSSHHPGRIEPNREGGQVQVAGILGVPFGIESFSSDFIPADVSHRTWSRQVLCRFLTNLRLLYIRQ